MIKFMKRLDETVRFQTSYPSTSWSVNMWTRLSGVFFSLDREDYEKIFYTFHRLYQTGIYQQREIRSEL